jgi:hypothetical protein
MFAAKNISSFMLQMMNSVITDESEIQIKLEKKSEDRKVISILGLKNQSYSESRFQIFKLLAESYGLQFEWTKESHPKITTFFEKNYSGTSDNYSV